MREHKIWRQTAVLTCANAITRGAGFVLRVVLSRMLGAQAMGVMTLSHSAHMLFITPVTAGLPLAVSRITARHADARALRAGGLSFSQTYIIAAWPRVEASGAVRGASKAKGRGVAAVRR